MLAHLTDHLDLWQEGLINTVLLTLLGFGFGLLVAFPIAAARIWGGSFFSALAGGYIYVVRGTPLLVQVFLIYYGLGQFHNTLKDLGLWSILRDPFRCGLMAFVLNSAAYQAEVLRGGILGVPKGVVEAAAALGIRRWAIFRKVVLPITLARMTPAFGNEIVLLLKASAIVSIITVRDVMGQTKYLYAQTFDLSVYYVAALNYLLIVLLVEALWRRFEQGNVWLKYEGKR